MRPGNPRRLRVSARTEPQRAPAAPYAPAQPCVKGRCRHQYKAGKRPHNGCQFNPVCRAAVGVIGASPAARGGTVPYQTASAIIDPSPSARGGCSAQRPRVGRDLLDQAEHDWPNRMRASVTRQHRADSWIDSCPRARPLVAESEIAILAVRGLHCV